MQAGAPRHPLKNLDHSQSDTTGIKLKGRSLSGPREVQLKERSQSSIAAAHILENKAALKKMTEHHQEHSKKALYDK